MFRHNPSVPRLAPSEVTPAREEVFTERGFDEAAIHPYLVKALREAGIRRMTAVQVRRNGMGGFQLKSFWVVCEKVIMAKYA